MTTSNTTKALDFPKGHKTSSNVWAKKEFQKMLRDVKAQGLTVTKINSGYTVDNGNVLLIKAMNGNNGYLVKCISNLFD